MFRVQIQGSGFRVRAYRAQAPTAPVPSLPGLGSQKALGGEGEFRV